MSTISVKNSPSLYAIAISIVAFGSLNVVFSQEDQTAIFDKILASQDARKLVYDTGRFVWTKTDKHASGEVTATKYEYWALHGEYYRLDVSVSDSGNTDDFVKRSLTIARPEGFGLFHPPTDSGSVALMDFGTFDSGKARIFGTYTFRMADRLSLDYLSSIIRMRAKSPEINDLKVSESESNDFLISYSRLHPEGDQLYRAVLDRSNHRVLSWEYRGIGNDGVRKTHQTATYRYDDSQPHSPVEVSEVVNANFDVAIIATDVKLVEYDSAPPSIEMFELAGLEHSSRVSSNIWIRRLGLFVTGVLLLAGYYSYRRRKAALAAR